MNNFLIAGSVFVTAVVYAFLLFVIFLFLFRRKAALTFLTEVRSELVKCSWPWDPQQTGFRRYKELYDSTVVVSMTSLVLATYIAGWDFLISALVRFIVTFRF